MHSFALRSPWRQRFSRRNMFQVTSLRMTFNFCYLYVLTYMNNRRRHDICMCWHIWIITEGMNRVNSIKSLCKFCLLKRWKFLKSVSTPHEFRATKDLSKICCEGLLYTATITMMLIITVEKILRSRFGGVKPAIHSELNWAVLLCDIIPYGKRKLSKRHSFDRQ
jgi:hypothetical protein